MKVSIVIPAYAEEKRIGRTLEQYCAHFEQIKQEKNLDYEVLVVVNGQKDNTAQVAQEIGNVYPAIRVMDLPQAGKGLAIQAGFMDALTRENDLIGFVDADMATSPEYFYDLIAKMGTHDGMIASRYMRGSVVTPARPWIKYWGRKLVYDNLVYLLFGLPFHDFQCGAKVFTRKAIAVVAPQLSITQWAFDVELLYLCKKNGFQVQETTTVWHDQAGSKLNMMGSGLKMLKSIVKLRVQHSRLRAHTSIINKEKS
jgi:glycosyltransferase involved in cell wall biosynthesis